MVALHRLPSTIRIPAVLIIVVGLRVPGIAPQQLVGDYQTRQQNNARNYTPNNAAGVLKRLRLRMCVYVKHGHLLMEMNFATAV